MHKALHIVFFAYFKGLKIPRCKRRIGSSPISSTIVVNYCVAIKGSSIKSPYILKFAKCFAQDGVLTAEQVEKALKAKSNNESEQKEESLSQEDYLIKLFRKLNPKLKKSVIDMVKGLTTSQDNK